VDANDILPTLYIPHGGGPCFFIDPPPNDPHMWDGLASYLRGIDASLGGRPKAVLVISGHWETERPTVNVAERPTLLSAQISGRRRS
jgi:aromatic ring-opening dioxygenase catalytic subunit (LigB family)